MRLIYFIFSSHKQVFHQSIHLRFYRKVLNYLEYYKIQWHRVLQCGYSTFTIEVMSRHVFTHVPEKPYKCDICKRSFIQKAQLQRHMISHVGNTCGKCGVAFQSKAR